VTTWTVA